MSNSSASRKDRHMVGKRASAGKTVSSRKSAKAEKGQKDRVESDTSKASAKRPGKNASDDPGASGGSLVQQAIRAVANYMREEGLRPGDTLPGEKYFADELGVSRAVMREAFGALGALQIINIARGRKPKVSQVDGSLFATSIVHGFNTSQISIMDVWDVRKTIEMRTAELAASARSDAELKEIEGIVDKIAEGLETGEDASQLSVEFHQAIARASHNVLFAQIIASFAPLVRIATREATRNYTTKALKQIVIRRHKAVARAIARRDPQAAADAMRQHFDDKIRENWSRLAAHRFSFDPVLDSPQLPNLKI